LTHLLDLGFEVDFIFPSGSAPRSSGGVGRGATIAASHK
jgi:hypothetical protein